MGNGTTGEVDQDALRARGWFWGLLALAIALRAWAFDPMAIHHPDETLQYLEPTYRLLTGQGIVTWEYRYGMRAWLVPWLLVGPMAAGQAVGGALGGIVAARLAAAAVCLVPVVAAWRIGRRSSPLHGVVAMAVMALWYEQVYFSTHLLTESLAAALFLGAAALIEREAPRGRMMAGGALLALAAVLRFPYAPAAAVLAMLALRSDWRRWRWLITGAVPVLAASGAVDLAMGQWPFEWVWTNVRLNMIEARSAQFGIESPAFFVVETWRQWGWGAPVVVALAVLSGERHRPLLFAALVNVAVHSVIGHKEYRFIELSSASFVLLAAIGSVSVAQDAVARAGRMLSGARLAAGLLLVWGATSLFLARHDPLDRWIGARGETPHLLHAAGADPRVCGLGVISAYYWEASRAYLGRPLPIYALATAFEPSPHLAPLGRERASFNAVLAPEYSAPALAGFAKTACVGSDKRQCLFVRPGGCAATAEADRLTIERMMRAQDL